MQNQQLGVVGSKSTITWLRRGVTGSSRRSKISSNGETVGCRNSNRVASLDNTS